MENTQPGETKYLGEEDAENGTLLHFAQWSPSGNPIISAAEEVVRPKLGQPLQDIRLINTTVGCMSYTVVPKVQNGRTGLLHVYMAKQDYDKAELIIGEEEELE